MRKLESTIPHLPPGANTYDLKSLVSEVSQGTAGGGQRWTVTCVPGGSWVLIHSVCSGRQSGFDCPQLIFILLTALLRVRTNAVLPLNLAD